MALINLRNALMSGKRLPYDAEVEFLQSTGTQWINTGVVATNNTRVKIAFSDYTQAGAWLFGARRGYQNAALGVYTNPSGNNVWFRAFGNFISNNFVFSTIDLGVSTFDYDCGHFTGTREKVPITVDFTDTAPAFDSSPYTIYLWSVNLAGTAGAVSSAKIYATQIWQNGVLVRDFIPVRKGSTGYLYDRVSGKMKPFGNMGTGDFVLGADIVPVAWLEGHGAEYIDTGVSIDNSVGFVVDYEYAQTNSWLIGGRTSSGVAQCNAWMPNNTTLRVAYGGSTVDIPTTKTRHRLSFVNSVVSIDGNTVHTFPAQTFATNSKILLFNLAIDQNSTPSSIPFIGKIYGCNIYRGNTMAQRYLPIRVGTEGAMMDVLTRRIYRNAGTGAFTYGNDLKYPIPAE